MLWWTSRQLRSTDWDTRNRAKEKLIAARAVKLLVRALKSKNSDTRKVAAEALGKISDPTTFDPLVSALKREKGEYSIARGAIARSLAKVDRRRAIEPLETALSSHSDYEIAEVLKKLGSKAGDIHLARLEVNLGNWDEAVKYGALAIQPLVEQLTRWEDYKRQKAIETLGRIGRPAVEALVEALEDCHAFEDVRHNAAEKLGEIGDPKAIAPLITALQHLDGVLRRRAKIALESFPSSPEAVQALADYRHSKEEVERKAKEDEQRRAAENARANLERHLVEITASIGSGIDREAAAKALGDAGDARAVQPLITALRDETDWRLRDAAADSLVRIGEASFGQLVATLNDESPHARAAAAEALGRIGDARAAEQLAATLNDPVGYVRSYAAKALVTIGDSRSVDVLIRALRDRANTSSDWEMRSAVAEGLGKMKDTRATEVLLAALQDDWPTVRAAASSALSMLGVDDETKLNARRAWLLPRIVSLGVVQEEVWLGMHARSVGPWVPGNTMVAETFPKPEQVADLLIEQIDQFQLFFKVQGGGLIIDAQHEKSGRTAHKYVVLRKENSYLVYWAWAE